MQFSRVIGNIDDKLVAQAEDKLSKVFLELCLKYDNKAGKSQMGGDPLIFGLLYPVQHICTMNMPTAATTGNTYFWNPKFVLKQSPIGLRIICGHEAWHALYMHPMRRGSRHPKLWNIAVDYIVNGNCMEDLKTRGMNPAETFSKHLGKFMTLKQYAEMIKDPFKKVAGVDIDPNTIAAPRPEVQMPAPDSDKELTPEQKKELELREKKEPYYFADPDLAEDMKSPEKIYEYLYSLLPKCPVCGRIGVYQKPNKDKNKGKDKGKNKDKGDGDKGDQKDKGNDPGDQNDGNGQPGDGNDPCCGDNGDQDGSCCGGDKEGGCPCCGDGVDVFGLGGTVDDHMDSEESQEKTAKRLHDAMEVARKAAGHIPAGLEEELGKLTAPKISWRDVIRTKLLKAREGNGRNNWTKFKTRPLFSGMLVPKRKNYHAHFGCLLDCSGSMSQQDIAFGLSQLQSLDEKSEGTIVPADSEIYYDKATKIKNCTEEELKKVKVIGRGGTVFSSFFNDYEDHIGECDFLVCITDGYLIDTDIADMKNPGIDVIWLITSGHSAFKAPFGRVFDLHNS